MHRRMETAAQQSAQAGPSTAVARHSPEVIDVDLLEDEAQDPDDNLCRRAAYSRERLSTARRRARGKGR